MKWMLHVPFHCAVLAMPLCCIIMTIRINSPHKLYQLLLSDTKASNSFLWSASTTNVR